MRLLYITTVIDPASHLAGHVYGWIQEIAPHFSEINAIGVEAEKRLNLPPNVRVYSLGKENGATRLRKALRLLRLLWQFVPCSDVIFCQFSSTFVLASAPFAIFFRRPIVLWWTHRHVDRRLVLAEKFASRVITASLDGFGVPSRKVYITGHGVDTDRFRPAARTNSIFTITSVGRIAPIKHLETLIRAIHLLAVRDGLRKVKVRIVGDVSVHHAGHGQDLRDLVQALGLEQVVEFAGAVPFERIPDEYHHADVTYNGCPTGGLDKAVLESLSCGVPCITSNNAFEPIFGDAAGALLFENGNAEMLAERLRDLARLSRADREALGARLRQVVIEKHGLRHLVQELVSVLQETARWEK
jgi:glycosyltransferase involved in cell wall biosynthesis